MGNSVSCIRSVQKQEPYSESGNGHVICEEYLRTYKPYTYSESLQRALVSGVDEWQGVDDKHHIDSRYWGYHRTQYLDEPGYNCYRDKIRNLFPSVDDFNVCHGNFTKERRAKISASFLCFDCEKYLCAKCITQHSEHFIFSEDDKNNMDKWDKIETKIMEAFNTEGDKKEEHIKQQRVVLCDVVDMRDSVSVTEWEKFMSSERENGYLLGIELKSLYDPRDVCILNDNQTFLVINDKSTRMKIYNIGSSKLIGSIELPDKPAGLTEIPSTDPSQSLIALSFPDQRQIYIMDIQHTPAQVVSSISVQARCRDLAYCNNKLITRCRDYLDGEWCDSIHVMDMTGEIINIIDLHHKISGLYDCRSMCVHSESETIYVCHVFDRVTCLSLTGQVLHSTTFTDMLPLYTCVDRDQNVYVMSNLLPLYKLSSDLSERVKIIDKDAAYVGVTSIVHHKNKMYMVGAEGFFYIFSVD